MSAFNARLGLSVGTTPTGVIDATGNGTFGTISGSTITATTQFSGPGTGLTGTAASLTAGAVSSITSLQVTNALGFTPYNATNPSNYITGITSLMVTTALGYTPANVTAIPVVAITVPNMDGTAAIGASGKWADGAHVHPSDTSRQPLNTNLTSIGGLVNAVGWLYNNGTGTFSYSTPTAAQVGAPSLTGTGASGSWGISITGSAATITGVYGGTLTSSQVTTALGYTPYNATNPSGYISANQTVTLTGDVTGSGATAITTTLAAATVTGKVLTGFSVGSAVSVAATDTILAAFGKVQAQLNAVSGALVYQGVWNASTNSPALASGVGTKGYYYKVSVAGSTLIDGVSTWKVGDMIVFNGTTWDGIDGVPTEVVTVFGRTGVVVATSGDYTVAQVTGAAPLDSPTFTGTPAAPTPLTANNSTTIATTAFVKAQGYILPSTAPVLTGTNFTGIPSSALTSSSVTLGSTAMALGTTTTVVTGMGSIQFINAGGIKGTTSGGSTVSLFLLTNDTNNITRFIAGVDAGGFQWTNQAQSVAWMSLTSANLAVPAVTSTGNVTAAGFSTNAGGNGFVQVGSNTASPDPYGAISVTAPTTSNYTYFGMTRAGSTAIGWGINTSNQMWIGQPTAGNVGSVLTGTAWVLIGSGGSTFNTTLTCTGAMMAPSYWVTGGSHASLTTTASQGLVLQASTGTSYDFSLINPANSGYIAVVPTGTNNISFTNNVVVNSNGNTAGTLYVGTASGNQQNILKVFGGNSSNQSPVVALFKTGNTEGGLAITASQIKLYQSSAMVDYTDATISAAKGLSVNTNGDVTVTGKFYIGTNYGAAFNAYGTAGTGAYLAGQTGDTTYRISIDQSGTIYWASGTGAADTTLARTGVAALTTNGSFQANILISGVATGTAPLAVSSQTVVANLNADLLDGLHASAFATVAQVHYVGTTAIAANRSSAAQSLTGVNIDGSAGSVPWSGVTSKPVIKAPLRWFYEAALTTTVLQPAYRADAAGTLKAIRTQSQTPGTGTLLIKINGTTIASYGTLTLLGTDSATAWTDRYTGLSVAIAAGDSITAVCSVAGTAAGVTVQLDIEQTV
jgi:hypothetical protein